jgi:hypothetical protein
MTKYVFLLFLRRKTMAQKNRKFFGEIFWLNHYQRWLVKGGTLSDYAKKQKLKKSTFSNWKKRFELKGTIKSQHQNNETVTSDFHEVHLKNEHPHYLDDSPIKFHFPSGCYFSFDESLAEDKLYRILAYWI